MARPEGLKKVVKKDRSTKAKTPGLSEDRVVDSDSESEQKKVKTPVKVAEKVKEKKTSTTKKPAVPPPPPTPAKKEAESSEDEHQDEESDSDSDELNSDDESTVSESETKHVNGVKRKADDTSSSSEEEESSDSAESLADITSQAPAKKAKTQPKASSSTESGAAGPSAIPTTTYAAPKGFHPVEFDKLHSTFPTKLIGKQIWHITAPSSLPISEIKNVGSDTIADGSTVLVHKGSEYRLSEDLSTSNRTFNVFLPGKEGYRRSDLPVAKSLHLQQKIELPQLTSRQKKTETGGEAAADVWKPAEEGARPQPKGMRMRYKPPGFGLGEPGLGSEDEDQGFQLPKSKKVKKVRRESGDAMEGVESTGKGPSKEERKKAKKEVKARVANGL